MKFYYITLVCFIHLATGSTSSEESNFWLSRSRKDVPGVPDVKASCIVSEFEVAENLDLRKLEGTWHEAFRTQTGIYYQHGIWTFRSNPANPSSSNFTFAAKDRDGTCISPISGTATIDERNPSTIVLSHKGLEGKTKEEYKVIFTDYVHRTLLYSCHHQSPKGECSPGASAFLTLVRDPPSSQSVLDHIKRESKRVCIGSDTLLQQNGGDPCPLDQEDSRLWTKVDEETVCKETSSCALACPSCCKEQEDGCVRCHCDKDNQDGDWELVNKSGSSDQKNGDKKDGCVYSLSECNGEGCQLYEKNPGCYVCGCKVVLKSSLVDDGSHLRPIDDVRDCPTTCRTTKISGELFCNCSNMGMCEPIPDNIPAPCKEKEERYYFEKNTGACHAFYGSCLPDRNNFKTLKDCISTCAEVCQLPLDPGMCKVDDEKKPTLRYYFNRNRGVCDTFSFGGCGGNANNFESMAHCKHHCPEWMDKPESNPRPARCYQGPDRGSCGDSQIRYFYLNVTRTCASFIYSGCGGNDNNFETMNECDQTCKGNDDSHRSPCPEIRSCPCDTFVREDHCIVCPCEAEPDSGTSFHLSHSLLVLLISSLWMSSRCLF